MAIHARSRLMRGTKACGLRYVSARFANFSLSSFPPLTAKLGRQLIIKYGDSLPFVSDIYFDYFTSLCEFFEKCAMTYLHFLIWQHMGHLNKCLNCGKQQERGWPRGHTCPSLLSWPPSIPPFPPPPTFSFSLSLSLVNQYIAGLQKQTDTLDPTECLQCSSEKYKLLMRLPKVITHTRGANREKCKHAGFNVNSTKTNKTYYYKSRSSKTS